uniref:Uncharacterized protein n=1 Tax=Anguilla anguilla TaxID=7936 RepID=A0A0E9VI84_ANGAN
MNLTLLQDLVQCLFCFVCFPLPLDVDTAKKEKKLQGNYWLLVIFLAPCERICSKSFPCHSRIPGISRFQNSSKM